MKFVTVSPKEKEKKRNINNDLAILPSHDTSSFDKDNLIEFSIYCTLLTQLLHGLCTILSYPLCDFIM